MSSRFYCVFLFWLSQYCVQLCPSTNSKASFWILMLVSFLTNRLVHKVVFERLLTSIFVHNFHHHTLYHFWCGTENQFIILQSSWRSKKKSINSSRLSPVLLRWFGIEKHSYQIMITDCKIIEKEMFDSIWDLLLMLFYTIAQWIWNISIKFISKLE